ncbi:uncharacterized protein LOC125664786 [Ostrea edulis]|uniref:uncharacterized protein LOC125664786 n=1 Tax=Ostrea edulis TaxID=37623 RepID=UPI002095986D|nr:uncharacterized protein LOC125664786 [Ostrea edulis]
MTLSNTFVFVVLFYTFTVSESFTGVKLWRSDGRDIDKKDEHTNTSRIINQETQTNEEEDNTGLVLIWGSLCVILLAACGMFVTMTSRKYTVRQVKEGTDKLTLVENSLCRIKLTENPLYSIRWGSTLPTIPEEDPDEYNVAITGYLTFHKPLRTTPVSDAPTGLKGGEVNH